MRQSRTTDPAVDAAQRRTRFRVTVTLIVLFFGAILIFSARAGGDDTTPTPARADFGAFPPCERTLELATDVGDGILNADELREEFQDVARRARDTAVEDEARAVMVTLTDGDDPARAFGDLLGACIDAGALKRR